MLNVLAQYLINNEGEVRFKEQTVISIRNDPSDVYRHIRALDGSMRELLDYHLKVEYPDGKTKNYGMGDLSRQSLSSSNGINETDMLIPGMIMDELGDCMIEINKTHLLNMPQLGLIFSPEAYGENAKNINLEIQYHKDIALAYAIVNDTLTPNFTASKEINTTHFRWDSNKKKQQDIGPMEQLNMEATVYASAQYAFKEAGGGALNSGPWVEWGNWYLELIRERLTVSEDINLLAKTITRGLSSDRSKMERIYNYCRDEIRYEQVYQRFGEFIPNSVSDILENKFGDCKDYSLLMYQLARSIGIETELALCQRGRGEAFYPDITVSQFNHMILHFQDDSVEYWMDGTNRIGTFGTTSSDLNNQMALILKPDASQLIQIESAAENLLKIICTLAPMGTSLQGEVSFTFSGQYALDLNYLEWYLNRKDMEEILSKYFKNLISQDLLIDEISWQGDTDQFQIKIDGKFPNVLIGYREFWYISPSKIFTALTEELNHETSRDDLFFYPGYDQVSLELQLENLYEENQVDKTDFEWSLDYEIPLGPYLETSQQELVEIKINKLKVELDQRYRLKGI